jgi:hypothetical protein
MGDSTKHAILSPSAFKAIMLCPAKPAMERGIPDRTSAYADEGTNCHTLAAHCLNRGHESARKIVCHGTRFLPADGSAPFVVTDDMIECVDAYLRVIRDYQGDGEVFVEQSLPIGHITGEEGAQGTSDAVIIRGDELIIVDLKAGRGVEVDAGEDVAHDLGFQRRPNPQLALYALGALEEFGILADFRTVRLVIVQPRVSDAPSEYAMTVEQLQAWSETVAKPAAEEARMILNGDANDRAAGCNPHEDACRWCRAKPTCPALAQSVEDALQAEFTDLTTADKVEQENWVKALTPNAKTEGTAAIGAKLDAVPLIEMWCKAIRAEAERILLDGGQVPGYKLVQGRKGPRSWADEAKAEETLKSFRFKKDEMYDYKVISPTSAEKLLKAEPRRWQKMLPLIKQSDGSPSVVPLSDKRPALEIKPMESEFEAIQETAEDLI